ncbi:pectinesterase family protein [Dictyobacter aurantiacus]|uniref:Pectinesterase catalytic domain-containing protein n=1 Tax=Dictyobacter aurantiacus TaxID=1936993 RepID=A0A401ZLM8_9CHLR|nr:pectinesterase family protein [Dictyobacter aurantiacus]GCE07730.1 hypothetical protein KDAU_50590 [Dictyobacter aurantiacus]
MIIAIKAGTYREVINIPATKPYITLLGGTARPEDTVITFDNWSRSPAPGGGTLGTSGSATATLNAHLGRPWPATSDARAQVTVRDTWLPAAISSSPWQNWTSPPVDWHTVRYAEYDNRGPGAGVNANRPQLTPAQAAQQTPFTYLLGQDNWTPEGWL